MKNYLQCDGIPNVWNIFDLSYAPHLLYYSYIPIIIIGILLAIFIIKKSGKSSASLSLLGITVSFSLWSLNIIAQWLTVPSGLNMFEWMITPILEIFIFVFSFYFVYSSIFNVRKSLRTKIFILFILLPISLLTPTRFNTNIFDVVNCEANLLFLIKYLFSLEIFIILSIVFMTVFKYVKENKKEEKKKILIYGLSTSIFLIIFWISNFFGELTQKYEINLIGPIGLVIFISFLTFLIVKFKAFNIKLLGAQALVWALIILVGSQFLYQAEMPVSSLILTAITLVLSAGIGLLVVRSVKKVDEQRELLDIANKNQESLLHFITHQIKGFMTKSKAIYAGILEGDYGEINGKVQAIVQYGLDSETKGVDTIQNILNASNLKSGKIVFDKKEFDLTAMVKSIIEDFRKKISDKGLELEENISAKPIMFNGDELRIKEVLKNLLDNSIHYTEQGKISVTLKVLVDKIKYSIKDTGIGLSSVDKKNLFQEGGKGEVSLTHNVESTGYGLYIAKKIVEEHKGKVWAESQGRDKGSEFIVELPLK